MAGSLATKPGISHIGALIVLILSPFYNFFRKILIASWALNKFESGFLSILIFVVASIMGNFVGV